MHPPIAISAIYYFFVIGFCELSRRVADVLLGNSPYKRYVYEFLAVLQVCTCVYENHLIVKYYGVSGFFFIVFNLLNFHRLLNRGAVVSPAVTVERVVDGKLSLDVAATLTVVQLIAGLCAFRMARQIWWLELSADHALQWQDFQCVLAYKVPLYIVALFEFFGAFLIRAIIGYQGRRYPPAVPYVVALAITTGLSFGILFIGAPGLNPIIAFARTYGCSGINSAEFFFIYWILSIAGWMTAYYLERTPKTRLVTKED